MFWSLRNTLYWYITDNRESFIVARAFYAHVLCPHQDKICMMIYAKVDTKISLRKCINCQNKHSSHFDFQKATLLFQPYSDWACAHTSLNIRDLCMPYSWFYHDTTQNGLHRKKRVLVHIICNKISLKIRCNQVISRCVYIGCAVLIAHEHRIVWTHVFCIWHKTGFIMTLALRKGKCVSSHILCSECSPICVTSVHNLQRYNA